MPEVQHSWRLMLCDKGAAAMLFYDVEILIALWCVMDSTSVCKEEALEVYLTSGIVDVLDNFRQVIQQPELLIHILGNVCLALQGVLDATKAF